MGLLIKIFIFYTIYSIFRNLLRKTFSLNTGNTPRYGNSTMNSNHNQKTSQQKKKRFDQNNDDIVEAKFREL